MTKLKTWYTGDTLWLCGLVLLLVALIGTTLYMDDHGGSANNRFETIYEEELPHGRHVEVYRDTNSNQEVVCIYGAHYIPSCYATGRIIK